MTPLIPLERASVFCDGGCKALRLCERELTRFGGLGPGEIRIPNFPLADTRRGCLSVSDSHTFDEAGPGTWRFDLDDPDAHLLCHPTNDAYRGTELLVASLGRTHITRVELDVPGLPVPVGAAA